MWLFFSGAHPVTVAIKRLTFSASYPYKPLFASVTGMGSIPSCLIPLIPAPVSCCYWVMMGRWKKYCCKFLESFHIPMHRAGHEPRPCISSFQPTLLFHTFHHLGPWPLFFVDYIFLAPLNLAFVPSLISGLFPNVRAGEARDDPLQPALEWATEEMDHEHHHRLLASLGRSKGSWAGYPPSTCQRHASIFAYFFWLVPSCTHISTFQQNIWNIEIFYLRLVG